MIETLLSKITGGSRATYLILSMIAGFRAGSARDLFYPQRQTQAGEPRNICNPTYSHFPVP